MYRVETTARFDREFRKLDKYTQRILSSWIKKNLENCEDPRIHGKALTANRKGQWRYRIGEYRIICIIFDDTMLILALSVGHRKELYQQHT